MDEKYLLATKYYLTLGRDGYDSIAQSRILTEQIVADDITSMVRRFFELIETPEFKDYWAQKQKTRIVQSLVDLDNVDEFETTIPKLTRMKTSTFLKREDKVVQFGRLIHDVIVVDGKPLIAINPEIEGRVKIL